jgi:hypothetical protein
VSRNLKLPVHMRASMALLQWRGLALGISALIVGGFGVIGGTQGDDFRTFLNHFAACLLQV